MRALPALFASLLVCACTTTPTLTTTQPAANAEVAVQQYPAWLEMKPGYAETCINGGGCIPMTQGELNQLAANIIQRTLQTCRRLPSI